MSDLNPNQSRRLQDLLTQRSAALREEIRREVGARESFADVASEAPDPGDASFADLSIDLGNAAVTRDVLELRSVDAALARLDAGVYGECSECGYAIPYARLEVQPSAERCAPCQEAYEKTHAESGRGASM
jgi:RNA polymerase-binding transcription factor DksA